MLKMGDTWSICGFAGVAGTLAAAIRRKQTRTKIFTHRKHPVVQSLERDEQWMGVTLTKFL